MSTHSASLDGTARPVVVGLRPALGAGIGLLLIGLVAGMLWGRAWERVPTQAAPMTREVSSGGSYAPSVARNPESIARLKADNGTSTVSVADSPQSAIARLKADNGTSTVSVADRPQSAIARLKAQNGTYLSNTGGR